jgi:hypothetical protein
MGTALAARSEDGHGSEACRLQRAGWSLGETCFGQRWQVDGSNGENRLLATGASQAEAW